MKRRERRYIPCLNNAYFLTDPDVFVTDHLPCAIEQYQHFESSPEWQLVVNPLSRSQFRTIINFDRFGKDCGLRALSHRTCMVEVDKSIDVLLEETYVPMLDYVAFLFKDERKLETYSYTYIQSKYIVNVHVTPPTAGTFTLQVYGRRLLDGSRADFQPLVKYSLNCVTSYANVIPYPFHHTLYGASRDLDTYGVAEVEEVYHVAEEGEIIISVKPNRRVDILPRLYFQDNPTDLRENCFVDYSECFKFLNIIVRLPYEGYFKLSLFARKESGKNLTPFMTHLLKCNKPCHDGLFPVTHEYAFHYKCCIVEPLTKNIKPGVDIYFTIKSPVINTLKIDNVIFRQTTDDVTFEGTFRASGYNSFITVEGCDDDGVFHSLYTFQVGH